MSEKVKSANIAFEYKLLKKIIINADLEIVKIIDGYWKAGIEKNEFNDFQDIVVIKKK